MPIKNLPKNGSLLIELPSWIGDSAMATATIEALISHLKPKNITLVGVASSIALFTRDSRFTHLVEDNTKKQKNRFKATRALAHSLGAHDVVFTFRSTFFSHILLLSTKSPIRIGKKASIFSHLFLTHTTKVAVNQHHVMQYFSLFTTFFDTQANPTKLKLVHQNIHLSKPTIAIVPGAMSGSAKRWYEDRYASVAKSLAKKYDLLLLGGPNEIEIGHTISALLDKEGITNYKNLIGKTSIQTLVDTISSVQLFIGSDSGPMHIAAATQTPTVAIYGPTDHRYSYPWKNNQHIVVRKELPCSPCAKRVCPLKTHECMLSINASMVLDAAHEVLALRE